MASTWVLNGLNPPKVMKWTISLALVDFVHYHAQILAFVVIDCSYLRFHALFTEG
jgi:hypothetical protein